MIPETHSVRFATIAAFLDRYAYWGHCAECGISIWRVVDKKQMAHMINVDLTEHLHDKKKKQTPGDVRRDPGGEEK